MNRIVSAVDGVVTLTPAIDQRLPRLSRTPQPPRRSIKRCATPILALQKMFLERDEILGAEDEETPPAPYFAFSRFGLKKRAAIAPPPLVPAKLVASFERATMKSRVGKSLFRVAHGWYSPRPLSDWETLAALMQVLPEDATVAAETAALLWGIDVRPTSAYGDPFRICVARPEGKRAVRRPGVRCRVLKFEPGDLIVRYGIRCTSALRTALDMAVSSSIDIATHVFEVFLRQRLITRDQLRLRIEAMRGRRGVITLRRALALADPRSDSVFETSVRLRLIEAGLPAPTPQVRVAVPGRINPFRLDLGWTNSGDNEVKLGLECDSDRYHPLSGPKADADRRRVKLIESQGWTVLSIRFSALRGHELGFEKTVAKLLKKPLRIQERSQWKLTRWHLHRNAWTRSEARQLEVSSGLLGCS